MAALATLLVAAAIGGVFALSPGGPLAPPATGRDLVPSTARLVPADAVAFVEARLDLPGDQRAAVADFLARFPGFADRAAFDLKFRRVLERLVLTVSGGRYGYAADLEPWFDGRAALAVLPASSDPAGSNAVALLGVADGARAQTRLASFLAEVAGGGGSVASESVAACSTNGTSVSLTTGSALLGGRALAVGLVPGMLLLADSVSALRQVLEVRAGCRTGLADAPGFAAAAAQLPASRAATFYVDTGASLAGALRLANLSTISAELHVQALPERVVGSARVTADRLVIEARSLVGAPQPAAPMLGRLAERLPGGTLGYAEVSSGGAIASAIMRALKASAGPDSRQLRLAEDFLGQPLETYFDWIGDVALAATPGPAAATPLLVASVTDGSLARRRLDRLTGLLELGSAFGGLPVAVTSSPLGASTIVTVRPAPGAVAGPLGSGGLSYALQGDLVIVGPSEESVRALLAAHSAPVLAGDARFRDWVAETGVSPTRALAALDISRAEATLRDTRAGDERAYYEREIRPYLVPFDHAAAAWGDDAGAALLRLVVTARGAAQVSP